MYVFLIIVVKFSFNLGLSDAPFHLFVCGKYNLFYIHLQVNSSNFSVIFANN